MRQADLFALWSELKALGLATPNIGLLTDIICCPGGDFCSLANAKSIPIARGDPAALRRSRLPARHRRDRPQHLGLHERLRPSPRRPHRHPRRRQERRRVVPGLDRRPQGNDAALGKVIGPSFAAHDMPDVVARLIDTYIERRARDERFVDTVRRIGIEPFKERVYAAAH